MIDAPTPGDIANPLELHLGYHLRRVSSLVKTRLAEQLGEVGLTVTEASVLILVDSNDGLSQSEIGRILGIQRANMAPLAATLTQRGLIMRETPVGRAVKLATTERGKEAAHRCGTLMLANDALVFAVLSENQSDSLRALLKPVWSTEAGRPRS